jgi:type IV pilus assembly protein PilA
MLHKLRTRIQDEKGFTLIELLVVILIIGILAAIALPAFLGQQKKGQDSEAKANARNLVSHVESCFAETQDYSLCNEASELTNTGLPIGTGQGEVQVTAVAADNVSGFTIRAYSKSAPTTTAWFQIAKTGTGSARTCALGGEGGCKAGAAAGAGTW